MKIRYPRVSLPALLCLGLLWTGQALAQAAPVSAPLPEWEKLTPQQRETHRQKYIDRDTSPYLQEDLSLFIRCGECGKHYMTYQNKLADGSMRRFWRCVKHEGATHPIVINDENAKALICDVLGMETFDLALMNRELKEVVILGDTMTFLFRDGHQVERMIRKTYSSRVTKRG